MKIHRINYQSLYNRIIPNFSLSKRLFSECTTGCVVHSLLGQKKPIYQQIYRLFFKSIAASPDIL